MHTILFPGNGQKLRFQNVLRFIVPTYLTALFTTLYTIIDGIFVSRYVGTDALAAINVAYPIVNILYGTALLFAMGGSAIVAITLGSGRTQKARQEFSLCTAAALLTGALVSGLLFLSLSSVLKLLGATSATYSYCYTYASLWLLSFPAIIGKELFTYFIRADSSPKYSFILSAAGGVLNILLDWLFVAEMQMGVFGAGLATLLGLWLSCLMGIAYFLLHHGNLAFTCRLSGIGFLPKCLTSGLSGMIDQLSIAVTTVVFNRTALYYMGEDGIAAISIIMYLQFIFLGIYTGYSAGISPLLGYALGHHRPDICRRLEVCSHRFLGAAVLLLYPAAFLSAPAAVSFFTPGGTAVYDLALGGMRIYSAGYLCAGFNIFAAARLSAYAKGHRAALLTALRSFILLLLFLSILPLFLEINGVWLAFPAAECITFLIILVFRRKLNTGTPTQVQ